jgi:hypothetical protein
MKEKIIETFLAVEMLHYSFASVWFEVHFKIKILLKSKLWLQLFDFSFSLKNGIFVSMFIQTNWTWQKFILMFAFSICSRQWTFAFNLASSWLLYLYFGNSSQAEHFKKISFCVDYFQRKKSFKFNKFIEPLHRVILQQAHILCVSKIFAARRFVDAYGTKNPYQNSRSLWRRENWKPVKILGREINFEAIGSPTQAKVYGGPSMILFVSQIFAPMFIDDYGTKNPYQNSLSLWRWPNWKPVKILGREIYSKAVGSKSLVLIVSYIFGQLFLKANFISVRWFWA